MTDFFTQDMLEEMTVACTLQGIPPQSITTSTTVAIHLGDTITIWVFRDSASNGAQSYVEQTGRQLV